MTVTCPGCLSRFKLPEGVQPGARLRCSVCGTVFALTGESAGEPAVQAGIPGGAPRADVQHAEAGQPGSGQPGGQEPAASSPDASAPDAPAAAPEAGALPGAGGASGTPDAPEGRRPWAARLLVLALALGAGLCMAWQISPGFREAVLGRPAETSAEKPAEKAAAPGADRAGGGVSVPGPATRPGTADAAGDAAQSGAKDGQAAQPGAPAGIERLTLQNVRQYFVENKKVGRILVVEGAVRNLFDEPRSAIRVEAVLIGRDKKAVEAKRQTAGAQLSHFQLQVMDQVEMEAALASEADIRLTNENVPPGGEVPFMVLFYNPSPDVAEFAAKILDARLPSR